MHGHDLLLQGFTVSQVVHDYGDVCQAITDLAVETDAPISTDDFRTLNRCLDDAIAGAVTEYGRERNQSGIDGESARGTERLGFLAHELRNLINTGMLAFEVLKTGNVGVAGSTGSGAPSQPRGIATRSSAARSPRSVSPRRSRIRSGSWLSGFIDELAPAATIGGTRQGHHAHRAAGRGRASRSRPTGRSSLRWSETCCRTRSSSPGRAPPSRCESAPPPSAC